MNDIAVMRRENGAVGIASLRAIRKTPDPFVFFPFRFSGLSGLSGLFGSCGGFADPANKTDGPPLSELINSLF